MRKVILCIFVLIMPFLLTACFAPSDPVIAYQGEYQDLAATAIYSIPGVKSCLDDQIIVLDQDAYGRVLFVAHLQDGILVRDSFDNTVLAVVIMQKRDESNVYFYGEKNYLVKIINEDIKVTPTIVSKYFSAEEISETKAANHWGLPFDELEDALVKAPILLEKNNNIHEETQEIIERTLGNNFRKQLFREDGLGNKMYMIMVVNNGDYKWYMAIINNEGQLATSNSVAELDTSVLETLPDAIEEFMIINNWN